MYTYKMVQVPPNIEVSQKNNHSGVAAHYLQSVVNEYAQQGWEFYRVDAIGVSVKPGCLAALFGQKNELNNYYVITFRRPNASA